jgi:hypothetical protein
MPGVHNLRGRELSSVEFVRDYIQLRFDGPTLTAYTAPVLVVDANRIAFGEPGFRDSMCAQIGTQETDASVEEDHAIKLVFHNGVKVEISLRPADYRGPEAAMLSNSPNDTWVW